MKEWRTIAEATNYEVSNYGEVRNKKTSHILAGSKDKDGYARVMIKNNDDKLITRFKHRLAAIAFLPNPNNYPVINHKDEIRDHNYVGCAENNYEDSNLEWCTQKYNLNYNDGYARRARSYKKTVQEKYHGEFPGRTVYVYDYETHNFIGQYASIAAAARQLECNYRNVYKVLQHERNYTHNMIFSFQPLTFDN